MKDCIYDFKSCRIKDIIEKYIEGEPQISTEPVHGDEIVMDAGQITGMTTEDKSLTEGTVTFDIKFAAFTPKGEKVIINIEAQNDFNPGYLLEDRAGYYCARMVSSQNGTEFKHSEYGKIKRVYSIFICPYPKKELRGTITEFPQVRKITKGKEVKILEHNSLMSVVLIGLGERSEEATLTDLLEVALSNKIDPEEKIKILEEKYSIPMTVELEEEVVNMCNLSKGVRDEGNIASIKNLMETLKLSMQQAMDALKIPDADRAYYANAINGE
jgi:hypothetical protein